MVLKKSLSTVGFAGIFILFSFIPVTQAEPIDITYCVSLTTTMVSDNEDLRVSSFDFKGIARSNLESKSFDNLTFHGVGVARVAFSKHHDYGYIKFMDPDGNFLITENLRNFEDQGTWRFLQGTGKWKGIKGEGKLLAVTHGKLILPGTSQGCLRMTGTFELPK
jgi:hypothetical protein